VSLFQITCFRRQFLRKMWPIQLAFIPLILCRLFLSSWILCKAPYTLLVNLSDFIVWRHIWRKNWVNCAVLTGNSAGLRTVLSSRLSQRELPSSRRESYSFLSLPADTTMASSRGTSVSSNSFSRWTSHDIFLFKCSFLLHILRFLFFFRITLWPMWLANSKRQPCFYPPQSHAREDTQNWQTWWETCVVPENIQFSFSCSFFTQLNCTV
jgi:hypothetical protein